MTGIVNCECSDGDVHGIAPNGKRLYEVADLCGWLRALARLFCKTYVIYQYYFLSVGKLFI